ncbi:MAG: Cyclic dehypoxanthine futalosine synthase [Phycisphaerae bacterium]|nr:Cyclic dehypoxanthine futalosine synthase [Phycisphaerae bacterium]
MSHARITAEQALELYQHASIHELGAMAHAVTMDRHPEPWRTYVIDRNVNYSNVCSANCAFCNFYRKPGEAGGYVLEADTILAKLQELADIGGTQVLLQGGLHPELPLAWYEQMLRTIKSHFPHIHIHGFSPPEITAFAGLFGMTHRDVLARLADAGLDSVPGGGAEILVDRVRNRIGVGKNSTDQWLDVMRQAHGLGMQTSATMMFGSIETDAERIEHLARLRELQDETGGFVAFICWTFQHEGTPLGHVTPYDPEKHGPHDGRKLRLADSYDYLRMLATARAFLDNFANLQSSWVTQGAKIGQLSLFYGANDMGSVMMEENVVSAAGTVHHLDEKEIRRLIRDAGWTPHQRNQRYELIEETGIAARAEAAPAAK